MTQAVTMKTIERKLQKAGRKHARLYLFCNFTALMIISAYSALMFSPTVQTVFPAGGDSRKQMNGIFVMTLFGCVVFTLYASNLFFRHKSSELGVLMALGASGKKLLPGLLREVLLLSGMSSALGIIAGFPFVWLIWQGFRLFIVDSSEMLLRFGLRCLPASFGFFLVVVGFACLNVWRYIKKTNIMEVIREEHINEPVRELGKWCGPAGIIILFGGAVLGYSAPALWKALFSAYAPSWTSLLYAPVFVGLYMVMLHTVVHGWKNHKKNPYKNIISRSMMKFQGKQTVNNMIIVAILVAGACFGIFYLPTLASNGLAAYAVQPYDYFFHYRADQSVSGEEEIRDLAGEYGLTLKDYTTCEYITVGAGYYAEVPEEDGKHFHVEYRPVGGEAKILSEDAYYALTGEKVDVLPGTYRNVTNRDETSLFTNESARHLTNMVTGKQIETKFAGYLHYDLLSGKDICFVIDNADYEALAEGLTKEWKGNLAGFNIDGKDSYDFADDFYHRFTASFDQSCAYVYYYDRVQKIMKEENGEIYWMDETGEGKLDLQNADSSDFRLSWAYSPSFRILGTNDFLLTMAVFFMMFLFIFIVCLITALVVCYTRCQTIALNNRYIFDDLRKLGASPAFLSKEVRSQCGSVFRMPILAGMSGMYFLYILILYANDDKIVSSEMAALGICLLVLFGIGALSYAIYRAAVKSIGKLLGITG